METKNKYLEKLLNLQKEFEEKMPSFGERYEKLNKEFNALEITEKLYKAEKEKIQADEQLNLDNAIAGVNTIKEEYNAFLDSITIGGEFVTDDAKLLTNDIELTNEELQIIADKNYYNPTMQRMIDKYVAKNPHFHIDRAPTMQERKEAFAGVADGIKNSFKNFSSYKGQCYSAKYIGTIIENNKRELCGADNLGSNAPLEEEFKN